VRAPRPARPILLVALFGLALLPACSDAVDDPGPADPTALQWEGDADLDLEGVDLAVGSKEPAAQRVLGWLAVESLRSVGADVTDQINLGGTGANREALLAGLIDLYWEYPAVGWSSILQRTNPDTDGIALYEDVRARDLDENDIDWLEPAPAQLGYGFVASAETREAEELFGVEDVAEALRERPTEITLCVDEQDPFVTDPDGLERFRDATQFGLPTDRVAPLPAEDLYAALAPGGFCSAGAVRLGEPAIDEAGLEVLDDDGVFLALQPSVMVRDDVLSDAPELEDVLEAVSEALTTEQLRAMTAQVELDGEDPREVAREWLVQQGLASERPDGEDTSDDSVADGGAGG
jgi:osmoprotectant transport system substrate-binding protein